MADSRPAGSEPAAAEAQEITVVEMVPGSAEGPALVLDEPLSLWGGLDASTGRIIDHHHPQHGTCVSGSILFLPFGRGSSSASSVLAEAVRLGTAPRAFVLQERDEIIALGSLAAEETYGLIATDNAFFLSGRSSVTVTTPSVGSLVLDNSAITPSDLTPPVAPT